MKILWLITAICAAIAGLFFVTMWAASQSAPQEAAAGAVALAFAVIPYVFTRAAEGMRKKREVTSSNCADENAKS